MQLLLCSPAKRNLNFEDNSEGVTVRSRQVSETIKEVGLELENSPHNSSLSLLVDKNSQQDDKNTEESDNCSEHEKSDSEQEKDTPISAVEVAKKLEAEVEQTECPPQPDHCGTVEQGPEMEKKQPRPDSTPEKKVLGKLSKVTENRKKQQSVLSKSGTVKGSSEKVSTVSKVGSSDKVSKVSEKVSSTAGSKQSVEKAGTAAAVGKPSSAGVAKASAVPEKTSVGAGRREKSTEKAKPNIQNKPTTFASTVKTTLTKPSSIAKTTVPRMTRALTTITAPTKPKPPARKTAAGLLITTTPAARASPPLTKPGPGNVKPTTT